MGLHKKLGCIKSVRCNSTTLLRSLTCKDRKDRVKKLQKEEIQVGREIFSSGADSEVALTPVPGI